MAQVRKPASDAYEVHARYWSDSGGDVRVPVDPFEIAASMGVSVYVGDMKASESGYLTANVDGTPAIVLNDAHHERRRRFTCAHELGHLVDMKNRNLQLHTVWRDDIASHGTDADEIYANRFAAALLMPRAEVKRLRELGLTQADLARRFDVSERAMELRLTNLRLK